MSKEFYEIFQNTFPYNIKKEDVNKYLDQFETLQYSQLTRIGEISEDIKQGDIFDEIPSSRIVLDDKKGEVTVEAKLFSAMLISNSCDATRRKNVLFAPILDLNNISDSNTIKTIKSNKKASTIYIGDDGFRDKYIVLDSIFSVELKTFYKLIEEGKSKKIKELNQYGYYLLLAKLAHFLVRPESDEIKRYD